MIGDSCVLPDVSKKLAEKAVSNFTDEQLESLGVTDDNKEEVIKAIAPIASSYAGAVKGKERDERLDDIDKFLEELEDRFSLATTYTDKLYKEKLDLYNEYLENFGGQAIGIVTEDPEGFKMLADSMGEFIHITEYYEDEEFKGYAYYLKKPVPPQDSVLKLFDTLRKLKVKKTKQYEYIENGKRKYANEGVKPQDDWILTGGARYRITTPEGKTVVRKATPVTKEVNGNKDVTYPVLSSPTGNVVDDIGRLYFSADPDWQFVKGYDEDAEPIFDDALIKAYADNHSHGLFTPQGVKNLLRDFIELEEQIYAKWGDECFIVSSEVTLFGKDKLLDHWNIGIPDLLVIDENGIVHVLDMKTKRINVEQYSEKLNDRNYIKQVAMYINMLRAMGLDVDSQPHLVQIDTWYDYLDKGEKAYDENPEKNHLVYKEENGNYFMRPLEGSEGEEPVTLAQASINPKTGEEYSQEDVLTASITDRDRIPYMQPRLHLAHTAEGERLTTQGALLDYDMPKGITSYEEMFEGLTEEEKKLLETLGAKPLNMELAQGITTLGKDDIESDPSIISATEIYDAAMYMMYQVHEIIEDLNRGKEYSGIHVNREHNRNLSGELLKGMGHHRIIQLVGIQNILDLAFAFTFESKYIDNLPSWDDVVKGEDWLDENGYDIYSLPSDILDESIDIDERKRIYDKYLNRNIRIQWLKDHKNQFYLTGHKKLRALEKSLVPVLEEKTGGTEEVAASIETETEEGVEDVGDTDSNTDFFQKYVEGLTDKERWMMQLREISPKSSLATEVREMYEYLYQKNSDGTYVMDKYGWGMKVPIDATKCIETTLRAVTNCETWEEMETVLNMLSENPETSWMKDILERINNDETGNLKAKFFRNFRRDQLIYTITKKTFNEKTGGSFIETVIVNTQDAAQTMRYALGNDFTAGNVGYYKTKEGSVEYLFSRIDDYTDKVSVNRSVLNAIKKDADTISKKIEKVYEDYDTESKKAKKEGRKLEQTKPEYAYIKLFEKGEDGKSVAGMVVDLLDGVGIHVDENVLAVLCAGNMKSAASNKLTKTLSFILQIHRQAGANAHKIPRSLSGNPLYGLYKNLIEFLAPGVESSVESSVYQDGKTYYSYTSPSKLGSVVRNLQDAISSESEGGNTKFKRYMHDNFGRYTGWFTSTDGKVWLNDWLRQLATDAEAREAFAHRVELSFLHNEYENLDPLSFQRSILHNYFGSSQDHDVNKKCRLYALPTMSNKKTNEFIRMISYDEDSYSEERLAQVVVERVLLPTFIQECNRMADVLNHYEKGYVPTDKIDIAVKGDNRDKKLKSIFKTKEEIEAFKERIRNHSLTVDDLSKLTTITSGAKFHFLWYMNNVIKDAAKGEIREEENGVAEAIVERINMLLENPDVKDLERERQINDMIASTITLRMKDVVDEEERRMEEIGLFEHNAYGKPKYLSDFIDNKGNYRLGKDEDEMRAKVRKFIWDDIAANINIIQITGTDLAYYGNSVNYQKRIAMMHSPGTKLIHDDEFDDGFIRSVHISSMKVKSEIKALAIKALEDYYNAHSADWSDTAKADYRNIIKVIAASFDSIDVTDGQSYTSPTGSRKKLRLQGDWDDTRDKAYEEIRNGNFNISNLGILMQPSKPFVTANLAKFSGSTTMPVRRQPIQDKNSEYLIILAEALARGSGKGSKLTAICDFMEATARKDEKRGIDTVHFDSVSKVGLGGVIDMDAFDKEFDEMLKASKEGKEYEGNSRDVLDYYLSQHSEITIITEDDYAGLLTEYMLKHIRRPNTEGKPYFDDTDFVDEGKLLKRSPNYFTLTETEAYLKSEEVMYNPNYVDCVPLEDYIIQQEVPAHLLEHQQLYGSQIRILGVSDISDDENLRFDVNGEQMTKQELVDEYKDLHAANIRSTYDELREELGIDEALLNEDGTLKAESIYKIARSEERDRIFKNLHNLLWKELSADEKYSLDIYRACSLRYDENGHVIDFTVPLMDPVQSRRIQMLLNAIIKKRINGQRINGGPVVQTTVYDKDLKIRFKSKKEGEELLKTQEELGMSDEEYLEYVRKYSDGIAYYECYMSVPNATLERLITKPDGSLMSVKELQQRAPGLWKRMSKVIGYRIPTEDKYSMVPMKIVGFLPKAAGQVVMLPKEITKITGSDFDIDKMYMMLKEFLISKADAKIYMNADGAAEIKIGGRTITYGRGKDEILFKDFERIASEIIENGNLMLDGRDDINLTSNLSVPELTFGKTDRAALGKFVGWWRQQMLLNCFSEYKNQNSDRPSVARKSRNNRLIDLQWAVLTHADTMSKMLNPGNFLPQKKAGRIMQALKENEEAPDHENPTKFLNEKFEEYSRFFDENGEDAFDDAFRSSDTHNVTLPSSKIYFQRQNMQGSQLVGVFANHNVSHAFCSFQRIAINLGKETGHNKSFYFCGVKIGDPNNPTPLDRIVGQDGQLISKTIASFLAASVDIAKDPTLADFNINTFTASAAMALARMGFNTMQIAAFMSQPIIVKLSELYFKRKSERYVDGNIILTEFLASLGVDRKDFEGMLGIDNSSTLTMENLIGHLQDSDFEDTDSFDIENSFQIRVLKAFSILLGVADDLRELTFCTKFNSVVNAVGPTIADTEVDKMRVENFVKNINKTCFHEDTSDNSPFTDAGAVIKNDAMLKAFFETTLGDGGASEMIFKLFFPHYMPGFQSVLDYFKKNYLRNEKINSTTYNKLLEDYMYYLLTYSDLGEDIRPVIPTDDEKSGDNIKKYLITNLLDTYQYIVDNIIPKMEFPNALFSKSLGANCLILRPKDYYLGMDTLVFNSSRIKGEIQDVMRNAWSDLITRDDPNLDEEENKMMHRFGIDLFFYMLMRGGFSFNAKTMTSIASTIVKYNALYGNEENYSSYIDGLTNLINVDDQVANNQDLIERFCDQAARNHTDNGQIVPAINIEDSIITDQEVDSETEKVVSITISVDKNEVHKLSPITLGRSGKARRYINLMTGSAGKLTSQLFVAKGEMTEIGGMYYIEYERASSLGVPNNFVEFDANRNLETSFFEDKRNLVESGSEEAAQGSDETETERHITEPEPIDMDKTRDAAQNVIDTFIERSGGNKVVENIFEHLIKSPTPRTTTSFGKAVISQLQMKAKSGKINDGVVQQMKEIMKEQDFCNLL